MSVLKITTEVSKETVTTDANWTDVASCDISSDCGFLIKDIFLVGKALTTTVGSPFMGDVAFAQGAHRGKRYSGTVSLSGNIVNILTFNTGSSAALSTCAYQMVVSGTTVVLQVKGIAAKVIEWYGGFTVVQN